MNHRSFLVIAGNLSKSIHLLTLLYSLYLATVNTSQPRMMELNIRKIIQNYQIFLLNQFYVLANPCSLTFFCYLSSHIHVSPLMILPEDIFSGNPLRFILGIVYVI